MIQAELVYVKERLNEELTWSNLNPHDLSCHTLIERLKTEMELLNWILEYPTTITNDRITQPSNTKSEDNQ